MYKRRSLDCYAVYYHNAIGMFFKVHEESIFQSAENVSEIIL